MKELFKKLADKGFTVVVTTDHGSIRVGQPLKVIGDREVNTNLRYKLGKNLKYNAKEVFDIRRADDYRRSKALFKRQQPREGFALNARHGIPRHAD